MDKCITYEVSFERQISMEIDVFDKHYVRMLNLSKILKEFKMEQEKKGSSACER